MAFWRNRQLGAASAVLALSVFAFAVAGYHPYAEDGGVYVAGVEKLLQPRLFPFWTDFVTEHLRFSLFAPLVAGLVRWSHVPLAWMLLALYFLGVAATLYAGWTVAARVTASPHGRVGAVALLACWLTLPVAGTSLILMDPYLTARTFSTPLVLMALAWALDPAEHGWARGWAQSCALCGLALAGAAAVHPLMAGYGLAAVLVIACMGSQQPGVRRWAPWPWRWRRSALRVWCMLSRPPKARIICASPSPATTGLSHAGSGSSGSGLQDPSPCWPAWQPGAGVPCRSKSPATSYSSHVQPWYLQNRVRNRVLFRPRGIADPPGRRLQPLRCFQMVYEVMILLLGVWLGEVVLRGRVWRWAVMFVVLGGLMAFVQMQIYANSAHIEWPGRPTRNAWEQAFVWARENTPERALFALDARYITRGRGEDAQCFRAIGQRSALADYSKDGGRSLNHAGADVCLGRRRGRTDGA